MITQCVLDSLVKKYETSDFINSDPVQFIHRYTSINDIEIAGFLSALFAFGSRKVFIKKLELLFQIMGNEPYDFILNGDIELLSNIDYRFAKPDDIKQIVYVLRKLYTSSKGLSELFMLIYPFLL